MVRFTHFRLTANHTSRHRGGQSIVSLYGSLVGSAGAHRGRCLDSDLYLCTVEFDGDSHASCGYFVGR